MRSCCARMFLPDFMDANPLLLPIFPLSLVSSGRDYTGLDNLPQRPTCLCSFIKTHKCWPPQRVWNGRRKTQSVLRAEGRSGSTCQEDGFYLTMTLNWYPWRASVWMLSCVLLPLCNAADTEVQGYHQDWLAVLWLRVHWVIKATSLAGVNSCCILKKHCD